MSHAVLWPQPERPPLDPQPREQTLSLLIDGIGQEALSLATQVSALQVVLDVCRTQPMPTDAVKALQSLDLIDQTLRGLAEILAKTANGMHAPGDFDVAMILQGCQLSDLSRRLAGLPMQPCSEDVEFF